jgi:uncharacterized protein (TIGR00661 family)
MPTPVTVIPSPAFALRDSRSVDLVRTAIDAVRGAPAYARALRRLRTLVRELRPDLILNFFEPLTGIFALLERHRPPVIAVGHQFMLEHPAHVRAPGLRLQQFGLRWFVRLVGAASTRLALSLYDAPDLPRRNVVVCPPLLRKRLFELRPNPKGTMLLVYMVSHGYSERVIAWHAAHPRTVIHCFYDKPGVSAEFQHDATLTFHRLDGEKFLRFMAECQYVVSTAGFESVAEAAYLGKPLVLVPLANQVEQQVNALDAARMGFGVATQRFDLDRVSDLPDRLDNQAYRAWLARAESIFLRTLEQVTGNDWCTEERLLAPSCTAG